MSEFLRDWFVWCYLYLQHVFVMMYWVTIPGLLVCGFLSVRYRGVIRERLLRGGGGLRTLLYAIGLGMTAPASRRESLARASTLMSGGVSPIAVMAYFIASQSLGLYYLLLFTVLIGLEFGLGVLLGGLVMILLIALSTASVPFLSPPEKTAGETPNLKSQEDLPTTWRGLLLSRRGWWAAVRDIGHLFKILWLPSVGGLLLGGFILAADMRKAWPLPFWFGDEGVGSAIASVFLGPLLSFILFGSPLGNLIVAASIWKTWTLAYAGVLCFILASSLHPLNLRSLMNLFGPRAEWHVGLTLYLSAALSGLAVIGLFELLGVEVTHVPWFEPLVKKIVMTLPFTMFGTGGMGLAGKMTGM
ncbi:MAG: permease [Deltaproteobacteria bacterium]|nr:permease [Deltaproteobacteria bacterium]